MKYDEINQKIKNDIVNSFDSINKNYENDLPYNQLEIKREVKKEISPIIFSLNNKIKYTTIENINEINYFRLTEQNIKEVKDKIVDLCCKIDKINNKIDYNKDKNLFKQVSIKKAEIEFKQKISDIKSKEDILNMYNEKIKSNLLHIIKDKEEILEKIPTNNDLKNSNLNLLNNLKKNSKDIFETFEFQMNKKLNKLNEIKNKINFDNDLSAIKNSVKKINRNIDEIKKNKLDIQAIYMLKSANNIIKNKIYNDFFIKIKLYLKDNNSLNTKIIENNTRISDYKNSVQNNLQKSKNIEDELNKAKMNCLSKEKLESINNFNKDGSYNLKQSQTLIKYKLDNLFENIDISKKSLGNFATKIDLNKYIMDFENALNVCKIDFSKKIDNAEKIKNYYSNLIISNINSRKDRINKIENGTNLINSELAENLDLSKKSHDSNNTFNQQIEIMEKDLLNYNKILEKLAIINNQINCQQKNIIEFFNKLKDMNNYRKNMILNNLNYQNDLRKSINNYIYENKKQINEINRQNLINKKESKSLIIFLENFEKNIINNKIFLSSKIDNFIKSQNEINKKTKEYFNYNKKIEDKIKMEKIKRLKVFKETINKILSRFISINDSNKENNLRIKNLQDLLNKNKSEVKEGFDNIKLYLNQKLDKMKKK